MRASADAFLVSCPDGRAFLPLVRYALCHGVDVVADRANESAHVSAAGEHLIYWGLGDRPRAVAAPDAVADLFHELGHAEQPPVSIDVDAYARLERERGAWQRAAEMLASAGLEIPGELWVAFHRRRTLSLATYERGLGVVHAGQSSGSSSGSDSL